MADEESKVEDQSQEETETVVEEVADSASEQSSEPVAEEQDTAPSEPQADTPAEDTPEEKKVARSAPPLSDGTLFVWGTGRRKASVARVRIRPGEGSFRINKRELDNYFYSLKHQQKAVAPLETANMMGSYDVWANVQGGGKSGQAEAVALGLARAISKHVPDVEHSLRDKGLLTRDSRSKERKKPGQPGARKRFQFSKR